MHILIGSVCAVYMFMTLSHVYDQELIYSYAKFCHYVDPFTNLKTVSLHP